MEGEERGKKRKVDQKSIYAVATVSGAVQLYGSAGCQELRREPAFLLLIGREKFEDKQGAGHDVELNYVEELYYSPNYLRQFVTSSRPSSSTFPRCRGTEGSRKKEMIPLFFPVEPASIRNSASPGELIKSVQRSRFGARSQTSSTVVSPRASAENNAGRSAFSPSFPPAVARRFIRA